MKFGQDIKSDVNLNAKYEAFLSFLKDFYLPEIVLDLEMCLFMLILRHWDNCMN